MTPSADPEAYDFYLRGRHQVNRRGDVSMHRAIEFFGAAVARDVAASLIYCSMLAQGTHTGHSPPPVAP